MKEFQYVLKDPLGIHARPAGMIVRIAKQYADTEIAITKDGKTVSASQLIRILGLCVKGGHQVTVTAEGPAEKEAIEAMEKFFTENL